MGPAVIVLLAAGAAVAAYELWFKTPADAASAGDDTSAENKSLALAPSPLPLPADLAARGILTPASIWYAVPTARNWVLSVAATNHDISAAGNSLVNAILLLAQTFGPQVIPDRVKQVANYGRIMHVDWPIYINGMPTAPAKGVPNQSASPPRF